MTHAKTRAATLLALPITVLLLAGCSATSTPAASSAASASASGSASATASASAAAKDQGPNFVAIRDDSSKPFGAYFYYNDSDDAEGHYSTAAVVSVTQKGYFKPSEYASTDAKVAKYRKYEVKVLNNTKAPLDLQIWSVSAQDGDETAAAVYDDKIGAAPKTKLLPGRTVKWTVGFGDVKDDQVVSIDPIIGDAVQPTAVWSK